MSLPAYPQYTESGFEWLGPIPSSWACSPLWAVSTCNDEVLPEGTQSDEEIHYVEISGVTAGQGITEGTNVAFGAAPSRARRLVQHGDVLVSTVRTYLRAIAPVVSPPGNMVVSTGFAVLRPRKVVAKFLGYAVQAEYFISEVIARSVGVSYPAINASDLTRIYVPLPSLPEQTAIAKFLDRETGKIDALVEEQKQLIELLKEKRQTVISHAVTKGLNPNVPMKASGVEWLGDVPEHWEIKRLAHLARRGTSITYGIVQAGPDVEGGIPYIRTSDMSGGALPLDGYLRTAPEIDEAYARSRVQPGDVVIAIRATIGKPLIVPQGLSRANLTQGTAKFSPSDSISAQYVCHFLRCDGAVMEFDRVGKGATFREITLETLRKFPVLRPPLEEQLSICHWLETQTSIFDRLITEASQALSLLSERRAALISAAVTGKIDVRNSESVEMAVAKELAHADL